MLACWLAAAGLPAADSAGPPPLLLLLLHTALSRPPPRLICPPLRPAATQVASRLFILWGIVDLVPATRASPLVLLRLPLGGAGASLQLSLVTLLTAWCCSEVIRYSFFAFKARDIWEGEGHATGSQLPAALVRRVSSLQNQAATAAQGACGRFIRLPTARQQQHH